MMHIPSTIKNLVFDFGNVLIDIDFQRTFSEFEQLIGKEKYAAIFPKLNDSAFYQNMERSKYTATDMTTHLNEQGANLSIDATTNAWNALLLDLPHERIELLRKLKKRYRLYMLSNTNYVHIAEIWRRLEKKYGTNPIIDVFDKLYLSYEIGHIKPERDIYAHLLADAQIQAHETLFFDDLPANLKGAESLGIHTQLVTKEMGIIELLAE